MLNEGLPPKPFMMQVMSELTKIYCFLWERKDEANRIDFTWKELSRYYNKNCFRTSLRKLNNAGLLDYEESDDGISIELVGWDEIDE